MYNYTMTVTGHSKGICFRRSNFPCFIRMVEYSIAQRGVISTLYNRILSNRKILCGPQVFKTAFDLRSLPINDICFALQSSIIVRIGEFFLIIQQTKKKYNFFQPVSANWYVSRLLFTPAPCTCCMVSEPAPKCLLCGILCVSIVAIQIIKINMKSGVGVNCNVSRYYSWYGSRL